MDENNRKSLLNAIKWVTLVILMGIYTWNSFEIVSWLRGAHKSDPIIGVLLIPFVTAFLSLLLFGKTGVLKGVIFISAGIAVTAMAYFVYWLFMTV